MLKANNPIWLASLALLPVAAQADTFFYDERWQYRGMVSERGDVYDDRYRFLGTVRPDGSVYDDRYQYRGKIVSDERGEAEDGIAFEVLEGSDGEWP